MTTSQSDRLDRIEALVERNVQAIAKLETDLEKKSDQWDERYFQLTMDTLGIAKTIIATAGVVVTFSPVLQAFSPAIEKIVANVLGGE